MAPHKRMAAERRGSRLLARQDAAECRLVEDRHAELLRLRELRARALARDEVVRLPGHRATGLAARRPDRIFGLFALEALERARDNDRLARQRPTGRRRARLRPPRPDPCVGQVLEDALAGTAVTEPRREARRHRWADSLHLLEAGRIRGRDPREVLTGPPEPVVPGRHLGRQPARELDRGRPANLGDAEGREDPLERSSSGTLYRAVEVLRALTGEPIQGFEILDREPVEVAPPADHPPLEELAENSPPGSLDAHAAAPREVAELLADAGRALEVRAVVADGSLVADDRRVAHGA